MGRVVTESELADLVSADRRAGRTVAFANGCFDLLHVGHARYVEGARREADRLIVAVNDDQSVRDLKGEGRPILPAAARAELVAALRGVDYVVVFAGRTVASLLERLHPDVHCKGTDYTTDTVPERDVVRAYGGRIAIVGDAKNHSTHDLLAHIRRDDVPHAWSAAPEVNAPAWVRLIARRRVALGFLLAVAAFLLARPTLWSIVVGTLVALPGQLVRLWAAGHITKGREVTRSGPYRIVRHPLYLGSTIMGVGFAIATWSVASALIVAAYLVIAIPATMRSEEAELEAQFGGEYEAYRAGRAVIPERAFSLRRAITNREYRSAAGLVAAMGLLVLKMLR